MKKYEGVRFAWTLCGTETLTPLGNEDVARRFLMVEMLDRARDEYDDHSQKHTED